MSATATPYGMVPVVNIGASDNTQGFNTYNIDPTYATKIAFGDLVLISTDGFIERSPVTTDSTTAGNETYGVFLGCEYTAAGGLNYRLHGQEYPGAGGVVAAQGVTAQVSDNPGALYAIQANGSVAQTGIGSNAAVINTVSANVFGKSQIALAVAGIGATATLPLRIVDFQKSPDNAIGDAFTDLIVKINNHQLSNTTGVA